MKYIPHEPHYKDYLKAWDIARGRVFSQMKKKDYAKARRNIFDLTDIFENTVVFQITNTFIMPFPKSSLEAAYENLKLL